MSAITKPEWRRRCIAHLRQHGGEDLREYKVARRSAATIEEDQAERFCESGLAWQDCPTFTPIRPPHPRSTTAQR